MTKHELLLTIAIRALSQDEGSDFAMNDLVSYGKGLTKAVEQFYGVKAPTSVGADDNIEDFTKEHKWAKALVEVQEDTVAYLKFLLLHER